MWFENLGCDSETFRCPHFRLWHIKSYSHQLSALVLKDQIFVIALTSPVGCENNAENSAVWCFSEKHAALFKAPWFKAAWCATLTCFQARNSNSSYELFYGLQWFCSLLSRLDDKPLRLIRTYDATKLSSLVAPVVLIESATISSCATNRVSKRAIVNDSIYMSKQFSRTLCCETQLKTFFNQRTTSRKFLVVPVSRSKHKIRSQVQCTVHAFCAEKFDKAFLSYNQQFL